MFADVETDYDYINTKYLKWQVVIFQTLMVKVAKFNAFTDRTSLLKR